MGWWVCVTYLPIPFGVAIFPDSKIRGANMGHTWCRQDHFYQTRSAWSKDQGSNENHSPVHNCAPTVTKFCVMWEGQALPQDTKFGNCRDKIVDSRAFLSWSLILGSSWSGLIKLGPGGTHVGHMNLVIWGYSSCSEATLKNMVNNNPYPDNKTQQREIRIHVFQICENLINVKR